ncbi:hypothetical protein KV112_17260 [Mycolicibacter sp. MYC123]|uniref:DUF3429 domain-containing protein n=1 Tax=[Mycobacterium] zoologicum TaxID=2872311 RepID=A0ABU5YNJ3_9MYCO|nr:MULTISPECIES: hypothetical protein [unclassified Mycolicibacter]MEB3051465.1 hypothetical protein [Mycolicibacter sp. MYC123]MEB3064771.1 hypothetical protein [Mycolicibacter sp. MYC101]
MMGDRDDAQLRPALLRLWDRRDAFKPFAVAGVGAIVGGGVLASAIAAPAPTRHGVWAVAYLVLVLGVGQLLIGAGRVLLAAESPTPNRMRIAATAFNISGAAIVLGVVTDHVVVFQLGSALLFGVLVESLYGVRHSARRGWPLVAYRLVIVVLIVSIPIGMLITTAGRG